MSTFKIIKDSELCTIEEMTERMNSIDRQINDLEGRKLNPSVLMQQKKHDKIAKLNQRKDILWGRRALLLKANKEQVKI